MIRSPQVSVIMAVYNMRDTVALTLKSVLSQTFSDFVLCIIDDGSTDGTSQVIAAVRDPRIRFFQQPNKGRSLARNYLVSLCAGKILAFLDGDDVWDCHHLAEGIATFQRTGADVVYALTRVIDEKGATIGSLEEWQQTKAAQPLLPSLLEGNFLTYSSVLVKRQALPSLNPFDRLLEPAEDWDLWLRMAALGCRFACTSQQTIFYRWRDTNWLPGYQRRMAEAGMRVLGKFRREQHMPRWLLRHWGRGWLNQVNMLVSYGGTKRLSPSVFHRIFQAHMPLGVYVGEPCFWKILAKWVAGVPAVRVARRICRGALPMRKQAAPLPGILIVIRSFLGNGGTEHMARRISGVLAKEGLPVTVMAGGQRPSCLPASIPYVRILDCQRRGLGTLLFTLSLTVSLYCRRRQYDVIQTFFFGHATAVCTLAGHLLGKKVACRIEGAGDTGDVCRLRRMRGGRIVGRVLSSLDLVFAPSSRAVRELEAYGFSGRRVRLVPNGIEDRFTQTSSLSQAEWRQRLGYGDAVVLLYVGRLSQEKGVDVLVEAYRLLDLPLASILVMLGDGPLRDWIQTQTTHLPSDRRVELPGYVEDPEPFYRASTLFVLPSRTEGLSLALLEAMACGLPVVGTRVSGTEDAIAHGVNGLLVPPEDPAALADAIHTLAMSPQMMRKMGEMNRALAKERYTLSLMVREYIRQYTHILSCPASRA